jgi:hypothetical protein
MFAPVMKSLTRYALQRGLYLTLTLLLLSTAANAQGGGRFYINPDLFLGITSGYDHSKGLDFSNMNRAVRLEARGGYWVNPNISLFTGIGYSSYRYRQVAEAVISGPDTIRSQNQEYWEVPLGVRFSTYYGDRSVRTRYYGSAGIRACFLNDARHDYRTPTGSAADANVVRPEDFNKFWLRFFVEGGIDIPMDYGSGILIGLSVSNGLTRNANTEGALMKDNYGVLAIGGNIGVRIGLTPEKPAKRRRPQHVPYRSTRGR